MFSFKSKVKIIEGCFVTTPCCTECDWSSQPLLSFADGFPTIPRVVCPDCGSKVEMTAGKYKIKITKRLFCSEKREYIGFIRLIKI
jgi:hypothetical protein